MFKCLRLFKVSERKKADDLCMVYYEQSTECRTLNARQNGAVRDTKSLNHSYRLFVLPTKEESVDRTAVMQQINARQKIVRHCFTRVTFFPLQFKDPSFVGMTKRRDFKAES